MVTATGAGVVALLNWLVDVPRSPGVWALALTVIVPLGFLLSTVPALLRVIDRVLVQTTVVVGLVALVAAIYLLVVVGLGRIPEDGERTVLVLSMVAAALAALLSFPARRRLEELANQRIYGERTAPEEALKTFAGRMSRAVPMDELLLQLVENLRKTMQLTSAEVWTGSSGVLERTVSVPDRPISPHRPVRRRADRGGSGEGAGQRLARGLDTEPGRGGGPGQAVAGGVDRTPRRPARTDRGRAPVQRFELLRGRGLACSWTWRDRWVWHCTTSGSTRRCRSRSTSSRCATTSSRPRGSASSRRRTSRAGASSGTSTTGRSNTSWPWR